MPLLCTQSLRLPSFKFKEPNTFHSIRLPSSKSKRPILCTQSQRGFWQSKNDSQNGGRWTFSLEKKWRATVTPVLGVKGPHLFFLFAGLLSVRCASKKPKHQQKNTTQPKTPPPQEAFFAVSETSRGRIWAQFCCGLNGLKLGFPHRWNYEACHTGNLMYWSASHVRVVKVTTAKDAVTEEASSNDQLSKKSRRVHTKQNKKKHQQSITTNVG